MNRSILITCLVLILVICLVLSVISIAAGIIVLNGAEINPLGSESAPTPSPLPALINGEINPQVARQMDMIQLQVIQERGLKPQGEFERVLMNRDELRQRVIDDFLEDYSPEEAEEDVIILKAFGLLESDFDFYSFYVDLLSEQIAGFYDNETKEMVTVADNGFGALERLTYSHEYTHALQDQNYDYENGMNYNEEACEADSERCAAIQALIEGDASLSEITWLTTHGTMQDRNAIIDFYDTYESPVYDSAPAFINQDFAFPYEYGYIFVEFIYNNGGWGSVDRVYRNLPVSTEQILHPELYPDEKPILVELPDFSITLGDGWAEIDRDVMGEWYTYLILSFGENEDARLDEKRAAKAAAGWGGDEYVVYYNAEQDATMMVLHMYWDSSSEANEYSQAFERYAKDRFGSPETDSKGLLTWQTSEGYHAFHTYNEITTWILAIDNVQAESIWLQIQK